MNICPQDECPHWGTATKYPRKCYYEVQCWRGWLAMIWELIGLRRIL